MSDAKDPRPDPEAEIDKLATSQAGRKPGPLVAELDDDPPAPTVIDKPRPARSTGGATGTGVTREGQEEPTRAAPAPMSSVAGSSEHGKSIAGTRTTVASPLEVLAHAEVLRTRQFAKVCLVIAAGGVVAVSALPAPLWAKGSFIGAIVVACGALVYLIHRSRSPATFHAGPGIAVGWYVPALAVASSVPYFGPFSPAPCLLVLGIYVIGMGSSFRLGLSIYITSAVIHGVFGLLPILDVADLGYVKADYLPREVQIAGWSLVELILAGSFLIARAGRRAHLVAIGELERAIRAVAQREALLEEAREELRRALGSGRGRFTDQLIGHYRLGDLIGRGAMGEVYDAIDARTGDPVAVKMLSQASLGNAHHVQRFLRELRTAATIDSAHVVKVLEVGEQPLPHLAMERLRGKDLATILRDKRPMAPEKVIELVRQVGDGITAAGAAGIVHRDLKPQNLFLAGATWKVLDFGVSRVADSGDTLTAGHVVGTPAYMAPEQARGGQVDHRTDLYALAAIAYRALTGHSPYAGGEIADVLYKVVHTAPRRPTTLAPGLPPDVDLVLAIGLAKDPDERFANADAFADALAGALAGSLAPSTRARGQRQAAAGAWS